MTDAPQSAGLVALAERIELWAIDRRAWLFAGSGRGGDRAAAMFTLIEPAKLNDVDPQAWLADTLGRIADHPGG